MTIRSPLPTGKARPLPSDQATSPTRSKSPRVDFPVVALGASAGGLETFKKLFDVLPADSGMAFVLIQHLDPSHKSLMVDLLARHTTMPVMLATDRLPLEPNHVYLIPPGVSMAIAAGTLRLSEPLERHGKRMPLDFFLRSLADDCKQRAIAVILSGTGTDGTLGVKSIKGNGGLVIAQNPDEAAFDGMPHSAILSGSADLVLPVAEIPAALVRYAAQGYVTADVEANTTAASTATTFSG